MSKNTEYNADSISVLEGLGAVRKRPGMYIGSTDERGLAHCLWEIIDNAVDEALAGFGKTINITLHTDNSFSVQDFGRGIPADKESKTGLSGIELVFTRLHAGGKFGGGAYTASGGLHGVGASVVNALSEKLTVQVDRGGKTYAMDFVRGVASKLKVVGEVAKKITGTRVRFWPDPLVFGDSHVSLEVLLERARQTAFLVPGLGISVDDQLNGQQYVYRFDGGIGEFVEHLSSVEPVTDVWRLQGQREFSETVPVLDDNGSLVSQEVTRVCQVDIALRWSNDFESCVRSFVNIIATPKGGTHQQGFEQALLKFMRAEVEKNSRILKPGSNRLEREDTLAGLTAVITVRLAEPQFEGQTKEVLGTAAVRSIVSSVTAEALAALFADKKYKVQCRTLLEKLVAEMKARVSARAYKETQRRKNALENSGLPAKLVDCRSDEVAQSELFIVEGDSALGTARRARNSEYQALLPIRGKILNVQKASASEAFANAECATIIQVLGAGSGNSFDISQARYGKIIIMSDADVDGAHIRTLLLTLFFRYMRPMVAAGRVFSAVPPLHRVVVPKTSETIYTYSDKELAAVLARLEKAGLRYQEPIQRYKGLGEMDADQLADTTMDRAKRTLLRIRLADAQAASETFSLLMGSDVAPRKSFIAESSSRLNLERIDS